MFAAAIMLGCLSLKPVHAQIGVNLNVNIGSQPDWGPVGYDHVDYYYLPDADAFYDVPAHQFIYLENSTWVRRSSLPSQYRNINLYNTYKVVVNESKPWTRHSTYVTKYKGYKGRHGQGVIRDSKDSKYKNHYKSTARASKAKSNNQGRGHNGRKH